MITNIYPSGNCWQGARTIIVSSPWGYHRVTVRCPQYFMGPARASCGDLAGSIRLSQESTIIFGPKWLSKTLRCPHDHRAVPVRGSYDATAMCLRAYDFFNFVIVRSNKILEATMPVNPYDDRKVSLRRPHGNGDLDIVGASYTRRKANVTEAWGILEWHHMGLHVRFWYLSHMRKNANKRTCIII